MSKQSRRDFVKLVGASGIASVAGNVLPADASRTPSGSLSEKSCGVPKSMEWSVNNETQTEDYMVIHAINLELSAKEIPEDARLGLVIFADTLTIRGELKLSGKGVFIHARKLRCQYAGHIPAIIDVSGRNFTKVEGYMPGVKPKTIKDKSGEAGEDGDDGEPGRSAGSVCVICEEVEGIIQIKANGGQGGRGQDGGDGTIGATPPRARDNEYGDNGGKGGRAGAGGDGGPGGEAGSVGILFANPKAASLKPEAWPFRVVAVGGVGGQPGLAGEPGEGGSGGLGGTKYKMTWTTEGREGGGHSSRTPDGYHPRGAKGVKGDTNEAGDPGDKSDSGEIDLIPVGLDFMAATTSTTLMRMLLHKIELNYINNEYESCIGSLKWLERLSPKTPSAGASPMNDSLSDIIDELHDNLFDNLDDVEAPTNEEWQAIRKKVLVLLRQLNVGLDYYGYYGYPKNYVPLVAYAYYKQSLETLFSIGYRIECAYRDYISANDKLVEAREALMKASKAAHDGVKQLEEDASRITKTIEILQKNINDLLSSLMMQQAALSQTDREFQDAVQRRNGQCSFSETIGIVTSLISVGSTAYSGVTNLIDLVNGRKEDQLRSISGSRTSLIIKKLETAGSSIGQIGEAYSSL